jgi:16S rRNA G966 N2-methylase RsmD
MANRSKPSKRLSPPGKVAGGQAAQAKKVKSSATKPAKTALQTTAVSQVTLKPGVKRLTASQNKVLSESSKPIKAKKPRSVKPLPYTDLNLKRWREYDDVLTDSLWLFNTRERQGGHQLDYHGNCIPQLLTQLLRRYTKPNDIVLDLFIGSGTSAIEAVNLGRRAVGVELQPDLVRYVQGKLAAQGKAQDVKIICGNSANTSVTGKAIDKALKSLQAPAADLLFLHPPYHDIIQFSADEGCLSNAQSNTAFLDQFEAVARLGFSKLPPGRFAAVVIADKYTDGEWIPLGFQCLERMNRAGFITKSIVVKNMTGNEKGKGRTSNLWRYRALAGGFYLFKHEYVLILQKPG